LSPKELRADIVVRTRVTNWNTSMPYIELTRAISVVFRLCLMESCPAQSRGYTTAASSRRSSLSYTLRIVSQPHTTECRFRKLTEIRAFIANTPTEGAYIYISVIE